MRQKLTTIGSNNGLSPGRYQTIILTNAGILLNQTLESFIEIHIFKCIWNCRLNNGVYFVLASMRKIQAPQNKAQQTVCLSCGANCI